MILVLRVIIVGLIFSLPAILFADSLTTQLSVKPDRCIALYQGQVCYQTVTFHWQTPEYGEYCLFIQNQANPLLCWMGDQRNTYAQEFKSKQSVVYEIRTKGSKEILFETKVKVAWVYKSNRKSNSGWRLF